MVSTVNTRSFAWREEELAKVDELVPYNAEKLAKERGALYEKAKLPFVPYAVVDGNLVTGPEPRLGQEDRQGGRRPPRLTSVREMPKGPASEFPARST